MQNLQLPISVITTSEIGVSLEELSRKLSNYYDNYEWDKYLLQQNKIDLIKKVLGDEIYSSPEVLLGIYQGEIDNNELSLIYPQLPSHIIDEIDSLQPTRKRCISEYEVTFLEHNKLMIKRVVSKPFGQSEAKLTSDNIIDYRKSKRVFKELPDDLYDDNLKKILSFFSQKIKDETNCSKLNIVVHHTLVVCNNSKNTTNSPEGVHQDGMDYIVSALVIERRNIFGGKSIIYGADKKSRVFECELREGMSLLQADKNTNELIESNID